MSDDATQPLLPGEARTEQELLAGGASIMALGFRMSNILARFKCGRSWRKELWEIAQQAIETGADLGCLAQEGADELGNEPDPFASPGESGR